MKGIKYFSFFITLLSIQSCFFENKKADIDVYYTAKYWGERSSRIPLLKPLSIYKDRMMPNIWGMDYKDLVTRHQYKDYHFNNTLGIDSIIDIGVDKSYVYGMIFESKVYNENYNKNEYVFLGKYNITYRTPKYREPRNNEIRIYPTDTINKIFVLPKRWFVINVADSTVEAFFSKNKYKKKLKDKGISGKMYNIDSINKVFLETGILPWFPEKVKIKLEKE